MDKFVKKTLEQTESSEITWEPTGPTMVFLADSHIDGTDVSIALGSAGTGLRFITARDQFGKKVRQAMEPYLDGESQKALEELLLMVSNQAMEYFEKKLAGME